jgi:hypothetical protein
MDTSDFAQRSEAMQEAGRYLAAGFVSIHVQCDSTPDLGSSTGSRDPDDPTARCRTLHAANP